MSAFEHLPEFDAQFKDNGLLRFLTCGSVDDGKSTLIGRLLFDARKILADTLHTIARTSERRGMTAVDLSLLTDGLQAEREQGITIDVAYRYFSTGSRKYIVADAPGHTQYTRNMVTAASTANLAVILVDARKGVVTQTRRHATIAYLLGIPQLVVAINKMDLVSWSEDVFEQIKADCLAFADRLGITDVQFVPVSALHGDMVVDRGSRLHWYAGLTLFEILETAPVARIGHAEQFRFPVQYVCRPRIADHGDFRGYLGRVESGEISIGELVTILPSGSETRVKDIRLWGQSLQRAIACQSVTLLLEDEIDLSRGDMLVRSHQRPTVTNRLDAMVCWLSDVPLDPKRRYIVRHTTRETKATVTGIAYRLDINTLDQVPAAQLHMNDIARVSFRTAQSLCVDSYASNRTTGAFILIDEASNNTVGAGMIQ